MPSTSPDPASRTRRARRSRSAACRRPSRSRSRSWRRSAERALAVAALVAAAGCATAPPALPALPAATTVDSDFPAGAAILPGVEIAGATDAWHAGDRVLLGILLERGGDRTVRYLDLELLGDDASGRTWTGTVTIGDDPVRLAAPLLRVEMRLRDEGGAELSRTTALMPSLFARRGPADWAAFALWATAGGRPDEHAPWRARAAAGLSAFAHFANALGANAVLRDMLRRAVGPPPLLALLFGGRSLSLDVRPDRPFETVGAALGDRVGRAYVMPMQLARGARPLVAFDLRVTDVRPPLGLCGGLLAADAWRPDRPSVRLRVRLLGAKRGAASEPASGATR